MKIATSTTRTPAALTARGRSPRPVRSLGGLVLAIGLGLALSSCGVPGSNTSAPEPAPVEATEAATVGADADTASECDDVRQVITATQERISGLGDKIPGDIPGAVSDIETSVDELTAVKDRVQDGELKTRLTNIADHGSEALTIFEQAQSGEISTGEALAQATAKVTQVQAELDALSAYCSWT